MENPNPHSRRNKLIWLIVAVVLLGPNAPTRRLAFFLTAAGAVSGPLMVMIIEFLGPLGGLTPLGWHLPVCLALYFSLNRKSAPSKEIA